MWGIAACAPSPGQTVEDLNELEIRLKQELLHLVRRVNGGAVVELRVGVPAPEPSNVAGAEPVPNALIGAGPSKEEVLLLNTKLAALSSLTASVDLRADLLLEGPLPDDGFLADEGAATP